MWSTKAIKTEQFCRLSKHQKVNQFPRSNELTRKDFLTKRIQRMQEIHGHRNFDFLPTTYNLPKEWDKLRCAMELDP